MTDLLETALKTTEEVNVFPPGTRFRIRLTQGIQIDKIADDNPEYAKNIMDVPVSTITYPSVDAAFKAGLLAMLQLPAAKAVEFDTAQAKAAARAELGDRKPNA